MTSAWRISGKHAAALAAAMAGALAAVFVLYWIFGDTIAQNRRHYENQLAHEVLRAAYPDRIEAKVPLRIILPKANIRAVWRARRHEQIIAAAILAEARGYGGVMEFVAAFDQQGNLLTARIVRHRETPGIADFLSQDDGVMRAIDGVSGATVTSHAIATAQRDISRWLRDNTNLVF